MKRLLICLAVLLATGSWARAQGVGDPAPDFSYPALDGGEIRLADHAGKVVFLYLFGNTCPYCLSSGGRTETEVNAVYGDHPSFQALGLDLWTSSSTVASVTAFRDHTGVTYPLGLQAGTMAQLYATTYDRVIVVDTEGVIRYKGMSRVSGTLDEAEAVVADLLDAVSAGTEEQVPPADFALEPAWPNPFRGSADFAFRLSETGPVRLEVHDLVGRRVAVVLDRHLSAGEHRVRWHADADLPAGIYLYTLVARDGRQTRPFVRAR